MSITLEQYRLTCRLYAQITHGLRNNGNNFKSRFAVLARVAPKCSQ